MEHLKQVITTKIFFFFILIGFFLFLTHFLVTIFLLFTQNRSTVIFPCAIITSLQIDISITDKRYLIVVMALSFALCLSVFFFCVIHIHTVQNICEMTSYFLLLLLHFDAVFLAERMCVTCVLK